jgi:hypothetical protein
MVSSEILRGQWMLVTEFVIVFEFLSNSIKYCRLNRFDNNYTAKEC